MLEIGATIVSLAAFAALGRHLGDRARATRAGALAGYLGNVLARYNVPEWFLGAVLVVYIVLATGLLAILGASISWGGARYLAKAPGR